MMRNQTAAAAAATAAVDGGADRFLEDYTAEDLETAGEFLTNWLPFLSSGLCDRCTQTLSRRINSLRPPIAEPLIQNKDVLVSTPDNGDHNGYICSHDNWDTGSWKDEKNTDANDDTNSLGSWKDGAYGYSEPIPMSGVQEIDCVDTPVESSKGRMSWADMAQEDELESEEGSNGSRQVVNGNVKVIQKEDLSREDREHFRFTKVKRKKDFICLERVGGKIVNVLEGLELHTGIFSTAEQKRIVEYVYNLQEMGKKGELKERTFSAPRKWMRGKGRVTIQFGCCYNYATDKNGNPPGILLTETVDPIPPLLKVIIKRLVRWHVLPPICVPDSCIINIYDEGDCIPPHIDNHDFLRPFCTVSFLSECNIVFGSNLKIEGPGEFSGSTAIPLPVGSVLVLNGNGADVAKHAVPAVPTKRISITFRKMDPTKWPVGFVPEPDLQGLQPLVYEAERSTESWNRTPRVPDVRRDDSGKRSTTDSLNLTPRNQNVRRDDLGERSTESLNLNPRIPDLRRDDSGKRSPTDSLNRAPRNQNVRRDDLGERSKINSSRSNHPPITQGAREDFQERSKGLFGRQPRLTVQVGQGPADSYRRRVRVNLVDH